MHRTRPYEDHFQLLFRVKKGSVTGEVRGPKIGWRYRKVHYYCWQPSTRQPGKWQQVPPTRPSEQHHLEQCVQAVRDWLKAEDDALAEIHQHPK